MYETHFNREDSVEFKLKFEDEFYASKATLRIEQEQFIPYYMRAKMSASEHILRAQSTAMIYLAHKGVVIPLQAYGTQRVLGG
jgi:hypothetical protein